MKSGSGDDTVRHVWDGLSGNLEDPLRVRAGIPVPASSVPEAIQGARHV